MHGDEPDGAAIKEKAAEWFVRRRDGLPPEQEAAYQAWRRADRRHAEAEAELQAAWAMVSFPARAGRGPEAAHVLERRTAVRRHRRFVFAAAGLAAAAALALAFLPLDWPAHAARPATPVAARPNITTLPDGSTVELNKGAEIATDFTPGLRRVQLTRGEAFFSVAKDTDRPFVVSAAGVVVRAVGTAFSVRADAQGVGVLVTEGRVAVMPHTDLAPSDAGVAADSPAVQPIYLDAGRRVAFGPELTGEAPQVKPLTAEEIGTTLAWRSGRVEFTRMPLSEVAALFNRRNHVQISVSDPVAASIPISGIFWSDDPEGFVRLLETGLAVRSQRSANTILLSSR